MPRDSEESRRERETQGSGSPRPENVLGITQTPEKKRNQKSDDEAVEVGTKEDRKKSSEVASEPRKSFSLRELLHRVKTRSNEGGLQVKKGKRKSHNAAPIDNGEKSRYKRGGKSARRGKKTSAPELLIAGSGNKSIQGEGKKKKGRVRREERDWKKGKSASAERELKEQGKSESVAKLEEIIIRWE